MWDRSSRRETRILLVVVALLVATSVWQRQELRELQLDQEKALYAERLRTAQIILENEMLSAAHLTTTDDRVKDLARAYLEKSPW